MFLVLGPTLQVTRTFKKHSYVQQAQCQSLDLTSSSVTTTQVPAAKVKMVLRIPIPMIAVEEEKPNVEELEMDSGQIGN